jgi:hypothetical protein
MLSHLNQLEVLFLVIGSGLFRIASYHFLRNRCGQIHEFLEGNGGGRIRFPFLV